MKSKSTFAQNSPWLMLLCDIGVLLMKQSASNSTGWLRGCEMSEAVGKFCTSLFIFVFVLQFDLFWVSDLSANSAISSTFTRLIILKQSERHLFNYYVYCSGCKSVKLGCIISRGVLNILATPAWDGHNNRNTSQYI